MQNQSLQPESSKQTQSEKQNEPADPIPGEPSDAQRNEDTAFNQDEDIEMGLRTDSQTSSIQDTQPKMQVDTQSKQSSEFSIEKLLETAVKIATGINQKYEPVKQFMRYNLWLEQRYKEISEYLDSLPTEPIPEVGSERERANKTLFNNIASVVLKERIINSPMYLQAIFSFFRLLLVYYFPDRLLDVNIVDAIDDIFNVSSPLYRCLTSLEHYEINRQHEVVAKFIQEQKQALEEHSEQDTFQDRMSLVAWLNEQTRNFLEAEKLKESDWRAQLKVGDYVDALGEFKTPSALKMNKVMKGWCPAKILLIDQNENMLVSFIGNSRKFDLKFNRWSDGIAPFRKYTDDFDWRFDLKEDDEFDVMDDYAIWYTSTVLDIFETDEFDCEGNKVNKIKIGCRYLDPEGIKEDHKGRRCTGWTDEKFNLICYLASPNLKRRGTMATQYYNVGPKQLIYDLEVNDSDEIVYHSNTLYRFSEQRPNYFGNIQCISFFLNEFGARGGFDKIKAFFEDIQYKQITPTIQHVSNVLKFLTRTLPLWRREFHCKYIKEIHVTIAEAIKSENMTNQFQKISSTEQLNQLIGGYNQLLQRQYVSKKCTLLVNQLNASLGSTLLQSENLEKRLQGIKMITDQIRSSKHQFATEVVQKLIKLNVFENVFVGSKFHLQIGQRATDLMKAFGSQDLINNKEVDLLWETSQQDEVSKNEIYRIIIDCTSDIKDEKLEMFMIKVKEMPPQSVRKIDIDFVYDLGRGSAHKSKAREICLQVLWQVALLEVQGYSKKVIHHACKRLTESVYLNDRDSKELYICKAIDKITDEEQSQALAIKVFQEFVSSIPAYYENKFIKTQSKQHQGRQNFVKDLVQNQNMLYLIITDLEQYLKKAKEIWVFKNTRKSSQQVLGQTPLTPENIDTLELFEEGFTHKENVLIRLECINFILNCCQGDVYLDDDHLDKIWSLLMTEQSFPNDAQLFFFWFKNVLEAPTLEWIKPHQVKRFFESKIEPNSELILKYLNLDCFICIKSIFLKINESENWLNIVDKPKMTEDTSNFRKIGEFANESQFKSAGSKRQRGKSDIGEDQPSRNKHKMEIRVHVPPQQLKGIDLIWKMFQQEVRNDIDLKVQIIWFLALINQSCSRLLQSQKKDIYIKFTQECLQTVQKVIEDQNESQVQKNSLVKYTMFMLKTFFEDSEKRGTAYLRPHKTLTQPSYLIEQMLVTELIQQREGCAKHILLTVNSNMTVWELIDYVAGKFNRSPLKIQLKRDNKKREITVYDHCKSLGQLEFESFEQISVKQNSVSQKRIALINLQTGKLVKEAEEIFSSWFDKFSIAANELPNYDPEIHTEPRYMTKQTCMDFTQAALANSLASSQVKKITTEDKNIKYIFETYDTDRDEMLTKRDFLRFYTHKSYENSDTVWQNLLANNIGPGLQPEPRGEVDYNTDINVNRDESELPRYLISSDFAQLNMLFNLEQHFKDDKVKENIWQLISELKTNPKMYLELLQNQSNILDEVLSQPETVPVYKILYVLQIIQSFVNDICQNQLSEHTNVAQIYYIDSKPKWGEPEEEDSHAYINTNTSSLRNKNRIDEKEAVYLPLKNLGQDQYAGDHWQADKVIPLGDGKEMNPQEKEIGPAVPTQQLNYNQQCIAKWQGRIEKEHIDFPLFSDNDLSECQAQTDNLSQLKELWFIQFVQVDGLKRLLTLFDYLVKKNKDKSAADTLNVTAERECLKQLTILIKTILFSSLYAHSTNEELAFTMHQKLSIFDEEMKQDTVETCTTDQEGSKNSLLLKQEGMRKQFKPLISLLQQHNIGKEVITTFNFEAFQESIMILFNSILQKRQLISKEDEQIVSESINLWITCISFKPNLLNPMLTVESTYYTRILVDLGLLNDSERVRVYFKETILFICHFTKTEDLTQVPLHFLLRILLTKLDQINRYVNRVTLQYFQIIKQLLRQYNQQPKSQQIFDPLELCRKGFQLLNDYQSSETKVSLSPDNTLIGILNFVRLLIEANQGILDTQTSTAVLQMLVSKCLFNQESKVFQGDVTQGMDLKAFQQSQINKCQTQTSRKAAYKLLQCVIKQNPDPSIIENLVEQFFGPLILNLTKPKENSYDPQELNRSAYGFAGLKNLGSTCYMNSMIQQFYNVPAFRYSLLAANDQIAPNLIEYEGRNIDDISLHQWNRMFTFLTVTDRQSYNTADFCYSFKQPGGQPTNVRVQQDAQEFLNVGFERLEDSLKNTPHKYLCQNVFGGQTTSLTVCKNCGNIVQTDENFYCLQLQVQKKKTIYESLNTMIAGEIISDYKCNACEQKVDIEKKLAVKQLPNTLILHLNRIVFDFDKFRNVKVNDRLEFPNQLNMKEFMLDQVLAQEKKIIMQKQKSKVSQQDETDPTKLEDAKMQEESEQIDTEDQMNVDQEIQEDFEENQDDNDDYEYKLVGVVIHMGVAEAGHYISYINVERENDASSDPQYWKQTEQQTWLEFNDSSISKFDFNKLEYKCFGESNSYAMSAYDSKSQAQQSHNAYMLVYEKQKKKPLQIVLEPSTIDLIQNLDVQVAQAVSNQVQSALGCDCTAISRVTTDLVQAPPDQSLVPKIQNVLKELPNCFFVYPNLVARIYQDKENEQKQIKYNEKEEEFTIEVSFSATKRFIRADLYQEVQADNQLFLTEKQVYCDPFFKTIASLLNQYTKLLDQHQKQGLVSNDIYKQKQLKVFKILDKLIFDIIIQGTELKNLQDLTNMLFKVLETCPQSSQSIINDRILYVEKQEGKKDEKPFYDLLLFHRNQEVRQMAEKILTAITSNLFDQIEPFQGIDAENLPDDLIQVQETIDKLIESATELMPIETQKAWFKLEQYFAFFYYLLKNRKRNRIKYFMEKQLVSKLVDFVTKFNVQQQYPTSQPPFHKLVLIISIIVRAQPMHVYLYKIRTELQPNPQEIMEEMTNYKSDQNQLGASPFYQEPISEENQAPLFMNSECVKSVMADEKRFKTLYQILLKYNCESAELAQMIGHLSWHNYEMTRRMAKMILLGLNKINEEELPPYLECFKVFVSVEDEFQESRIEWILGNADLLITRTHRQVQLNNYDFDKQKIGVGRINSASDLNYHYKTFLHKEDSNLKEAVFQMLYAYRKEKYQRASMTIMNGLLDTIANANPNRALLKYFLTMEGPSYICRRYWDWIEPFYIDHVQECSERAHIPAHRYEIELGLKILSNIDKIKQDCKDLLAEQEHFEGVCGRIIPEEYVMWESVRMQEYEVKQVQSKNVTVVVTELLVKVSKSKTNGRENEMLKTVKRGMQSKVIKASETENEVVNSGLKGQWKRYGRGQRSKGTVATMTHENQEIQNLIDSQTQNPSVISLNKVTFLGTEKHKTGEAEFESDERPDEERNPNADINEDQGFMHDSDDQVRNEDMDQLEGGEPERPSSIPLHSQGQGGNAAAKSDEEMEQDEGAEADGEDNDWKQKLDRIDSDEDFYAGDSHKDGNGMTPTNDNPFNIHDERDQDNYHSDQENYNNSFEEEQYETHINVDDMEQELITVLAFKLRNFSHTRQQKISIVYDPQNRHLINMRVPVVPMYHIVQTTTDATLIKLTKLKPMQDWGAAKDFNVIVDGEDMYGNLHHPFKHNFWHLRQKRNAILEQEVEKENQASDEQSDNDAGVQIGGAQSCPICTYDNPPGSYQCEMCESSLK